MDEVFGEKATPEPKKTTKKKQLAGKQSEE